MKKNKLIRLMTVGVMTLSFIFAGGCGEDQTEQHIAVICKSSDEYWQSAKKGAEDAGEEMGIKITYNASEKEDVSEQIKYVNNAIAEKADVIVIAPVQDSNELAEVLKKAKSNNIDVIIIDSDMREEVRESCISTNNTYGGAISARKLAEFIGNKGDIGIITHTPTSATAIERKNGFIKQIDEYNSESDTPLMNVVATENGDGDIQQSKEATIKLINDYPDLKAVFATNQGGTIGACMAVEELGKADSVQIVGFDSFSKGDGYRSATEYTEDDILDGFIVQNPYNMGYLGVRYAKDIIDGQTIADSIDTGATLVTKENLHDSDVQLIMNPMLN